MVQQYQAEIDAFMDQVKARDGHQPEFLQAVHEVAESVIPFIADKAQVQGSKNSR